MVRPSTLSIEQRLQALENQQTISTQPQSAAPVASSPAIKVTVPVSATPGQVVRLHDGEWFLADSTQAERALVAVVSRVVGVTPPSCEVVLWGLRFADGTPGDFYYLSATPGVLSTTPPTIGSGVGDENPTEEWTHIVEVQVTPTYRLVRPDAWKRRVQRAQTCESIDGVDTPGERLFGELTEEPAP